MHPAFYWWWKNARRDGHGCGPRAHASGCGPGGGGGGEGGGFGHGHGHGHGGGARFGGGSPDEIFGGGGPFGVRRPLRFLAHKLDLSEEQIAQLATILNELKTERAQAAVDWRRTTSAFADAIASDALDEAKVGASTDERVKASERVQR